MLIPSLFVVSQKTDFQYCSQCIFRQQPYEGGKYYCSASLSEADRAQAFAAQVGPRELYPTCAAANPEACCSYHIPATGVWAHAPLAANEVGLTSFVYDLVMCDEKAQACSLCTHQHRAGVLTKSPDDLCSAVVNKRAVNGVFINAVGVQRSKKTEYPFSRCVDVKKGTCRRFKQAGLFLRSFRALQASIILEDTPPPKSLAGMFARLAHYCSPEEERRMEIEGLEQKIQKLKTQKTYSPMREMGSAVRGFCKTMLAC